MEHKNSSEPKNKDTGINKKSPISSSAQNSMARNIKEEPPQPKKIEEPIAPEPKIPVTPEEIPNPIDPLRKGEIRFDDGKPFREKEKGKDSESHGEEKQDKVLNKKGNATKSKSAKNTESKESERDKHRDRIRGVKYAYAFALLLAFGGALFAKISTEKALGNITTPIEDSYVIRETINAPSPDTTRDITEKPFEDDDLKVRQNLTNVPDTREYTENKIEASPQDKNKTKEEAEKEPFATPYKDYYALPLGTKIIRDYSPQKPYFNPTTEDWRTHNGIDFGGAEGAQVKSISYGTVKSIYDDALYGTVIEIDHGNGVLAKYCGFNKDVIEVKPTQKVKEGQLLGYLGEIPLEKSQLSHLHFEIYYNNKNVDPLELMGK